MENTTQTPGTLKPIPDGDYVVDVIRVVKRPSQNGGWLVEIKYLIREGECRGRVLYQVCKPTVKEDRRRINLLVKAARCKYIRRITEKNINFWLHADMFGLDALQPKVSVTVGQKTLEDKIYNTAMCNGRLIWV